MKHPFISLLLLLASANVYGQVERADSIELSDSEVHSPEVMHPISLPGEMPWAAGGSSVAGPLPWMAPLVNSVGRMPEFKPEPIYPGRIAAWSGGTLYGMTDSRSMPGLMGIEEVRIGVGHSVGRFSFTAYGEALKYAGFRSLTTSVGFGGSVSYTVNERVSLTLFGSYYTSPGRMSAAYCISCCTTTVIIA